MADDNDSSDCVGYRRPPKASQFKKGQSGNSSGRPKKDRGRAAIAARVLGEIQRLAGQPRGARVRFTALEMIVMLLKQMMASGHHRAAALFSRFAARFGSQEANGQDVGYLIVPESLTIEEWEARYSPKDEPPPIEGDD